MRDEKRVDDRILWKSQPWASVQTEILELRLGLRIDEDWDSGTRQGA